MTANTLLSSTSVAQTFANPIAVRFFEFYENYKETGQPFTARDILGEPPVVPDSPDTDARLEAYDELVEYSRKYQDIESKIDCIVKWGA